MLSYIYEYVLCYVLRFLLEEENTIGIIESDQLILL